MKITEQELKQIIKEELQRVLQEEERNYSPAGKDLADKIDEMAFEFGIEDYYSSKEIEQEVIEKAVEFINNNPVDNVFDSDVAEYDMVEDWEDDVLKNEDAYEDLSIFTSSDSNKEFIFALYSGYYYDQIW